MFKMMKNLLTMAALAVVSSMPSFAQSGVGQKADRVNGLMLKPHRLNPENGGGSGWIGAGMDAKQGLASSSDLNPVSLRNLHDFSLLRRIQLSPDLILKNNSNTSAKKAEHWVQQLTLKTAGMFTAMAVFAKNTLGARGASNCESAVATYKALGRGASFA